ncbi:hypothetical protein LA080_002582 [Diaporthe eres]|nr:hypothetical protein LA080_002582 [Diaporthe eres]
MADHLDFIICSDFRCIVGNVLWDMVAYLDQETIDWILSIGGLKAIIISHPHYYASMNEWMTAFNCLVYTAPEDQEWLKNTPAERRVTFLHDEAMEILPGVTALKVGGHFPGSFLLHWDKHLFHGDTLITNWEEEAEMRRIVNDAKPSGERFAPIFQSMVGD